MNGIYWSRMLPFHSKVAIFASFVRLNGTYHTIFFCGWRIIDCGRRIKCLHSLVSVQTSLVYKRTQIYHLCCLKVMRHSFRHTLCLLKVKSCFVIPVCSFVHKMNCYWWRYDFYQLCFFSVLAWRLKLVSKWNLWTSQTGRSLLPCSW